MRIILILFVAVFFHPEANGQLLRDLKNMANDKVKTLATKENLNKATSSFLKKMEQARAEFDSTDFDYAILISDNAGLFDVKEKGERLAKATSMITLASAYYNNTEFTDEERARFQQESGELAYGSGHYAMAEKRLNSALQIYEEAGLTETTGYLKTLSTLGLLYGTMGRYTQAENFTVTAIDMRRQVLGENSMAMVSSLNNYGVLHHNLARYNEAEKELAKASEVARLQRQEASMPYAIILNNQAMLFQTMGRLDAAERTLKQAIEIAERLQSKKSKNHLKFLSNLALLYQQMGKYQEAERIYLDMERRLGKNNPDYAAMLSNQAGLYLTMGKTDRIEPLLKTAADIYKNNFGENNPAYARVISDLGNFYRISERYTDALPLLEKALAIREKTLGVDHPQYADAQESLAILHWKNGAAEKARSYYDAVMKKSLEFVNTYFPPMSEAEKTKYWDVLLPRFQRFYNFAIETAAENKDVLRDLFEYQLATKALLLNSTSKVKRAILASNDPLLIRDYFTWLDQKEQLARLYAYSRDELKEQKINLDSIETAANAMEKSLSERSTDFSQGYRASTINYQTVRDLLGENEILIDIIRVRKFGQTFEEGSRYIALIVKRGVSLPVMKVLENGEQLETRYARFYRNAIQQKIDDDYSYEQYWSEIDREIAGRKVVYVSPDGVYNQINLNTLKGPNGYLVNQYDLTLLGNARDLVALKSRKVSAVSKNAVVLGFPDYGGAALAPLPGTKAEVESIASILRSAGYKITTLTEKGATESKLKEVKGPRVLHVATHGYFLEDVSRNGSAFGISIDNASDNPLLRSGLMLAGASATVTGSMSPNLTANDNGILTAYEAMNLDLEGTALVVMSACETGLGDVKAGEGVYGLQRAFIVAGAEALIMSLWKVDDAATQLLMKNFYSAWLKLGNKHQAFKQAQVQLMRQYKEPFYWGAFVMMGQ